MSNNEQTEHLTKLFTGLIRDRLAPNSMFDLDHIRSQFGKLLTAEGFTYDQLWDAIYFSQEDIFWKKVIVNVNKFFKHRQQLVLKSEGYRCPRVEEDIIPVVIEKKSLLQLHKEKQNGQKA